MKLTIYALLAAASIAYAPGMASAADPAGDWAKNCASCHAKDGSGSTMMGKRLGVKDLRDAKVQAALTDANAISTIQNGVVESGKQNMKAYKDTLSADQIKALVTYIRSLKK
ncbi:MAG TPA: c-type cytochrome [Chthoniobacterales bacterium]|nr:c-type cytochrome [Chthoniobacterales bacterium]